MKTLTSLLTTALLGAALTAPAALQIDYDNKGADLAFNPTVSTNIDLALAATANWQAAPPDRGRGVYDSNQWAVVFKFSSINIPANVTVTFSNHPSRAPVVWLVESNATIAGTVSLNGQNGDGDGNRIRFAEPGPGGFRGGDGNIPNGGANATSGFGPGGGRGYEGNDLQNASFATTGFNAGRFSPAPTYGGPSLIPLIGGSGNGPWVNYPTLGGGAGGGAILLAVSGNLALTGLIRANGGADAQGGGTGGGIRIVCETTTGDGRLEAVTPTPDRSSQGRIRVECLNNEPTFSYQPNTFRELPRVPAQLWPETNAPTARIVSINNTLNAPADPRANMNVGTVADLRLTAGSRTNLVTIETAYLPTNAVVTLRVISTPSGGDVRTNAVFSQVVSNNVLRWQQTVVIEPGYHALQVVARAP